MTELDLKDIIVILTDVTMRNTIWLYGNDTNVLMSPTNNLYSNLTNAWWSVMKGIVRDCSG